MKSCFLTLILITMLFGTNAQNKVYDQNGKHLSFSDEDIDITFSPSTIKFLPAPPAEKKEFAGALLSLIPTAVDVAFKTTTKILENRVKRFTAEYTKQKSNIDAGNSVVPDFQFIREFTINKTETTALKISVKAQKVDNLEAFVYYIDDIELNYSSARTAKSSRVFDYTIELKATISTKGESKVIDLAPIVISSISFGPHTFSPLKHRTDLIMLPQGGILTQISVKIIETNPIKVRAEKIAATWNDYKDDGKTIINNFLPSASEKKDSNDDKTQEGGDGSTGNGDGKKTNGKSNNKSGNK